MILKRGVDISKTHPQILVRLGEHEGVFAACGLPYRITSGCEGQVGDGVHGADSLHYVENNSDGWSRAIDVGVKDARGKFISKTEFLQEILPGTIRIFPLAYFSYEYRYGPWCADPEHPRAKQTPHLHIQIRRGVLLPLTGELMDLNEVKPVDVEIGPRTPDRRVPRVEPLPDKKVAEVRRNYAETAKKAKGGVPVYRRDGFKRILSGLILVAGGVLRLIPQTSAIGEGLILIGGAGQAIGWGHAAKKRKDRGEKPFWRMVWNFIKGLIEQIIKGAKDERRDP